MGMGLNIPGNLSANEIAIINRTKKPKEKPMCEMTLKEKIEYWNYDPKHPLTNECLKKRSETQRGGKRR